MTKTPRTFTPQEKTQVALAAIQGEKTLGQISSDFQVHTTQVKLWKRQVLEYMPEAFKDHVQQKHKQDLQHQQEKDNLYKIIGQRDTELDFLKKKMSMFSP